MIHLATTPLNCDWKSVTSCLISTMDKTHHRSITVLSMCAFQNVLNSFLAILVSQLERVLVVNSLF